MRHSIHCFLLISAMLLFAGCGGGGGGNVKPDVFETEYKAQYGLGLINASSMYARGGTGKEQTVAVIDSGGTPTHSDLDGAYSAVKCFKLGAWIEEPGCGVDLHGHGTHVAGIIAAERNGVGMHGVAYEASVVSYDFLTGPQLGLGEALDDIAAEGIRIVNNSWGTHCTDDVGDRTACVVADLDPTGALRPDALQYAQDLHDVGFTDFATQGGVAVWAMGNQGFDPDGTCPAGEFCTTSPSIEGALPYMWGSNGLNVSATADALEKGWLAVVAVGQDGDIAYYSQHCEEAADWCIAAPGGDRSEDVGILSTVSDGSYDYYQGTSMAAPHVAGALAALKSMFPNLSFQAVRKRILTTADDSGTYATESIYGQGLLDLDAASRPVGGTSFALSGYDHGAVVTTVGAGIRLPAGALARYLDGRRILILDNYQRAPFAMPILAFAGEEARYLSLGDLGLSRPERIWVDERDERLGLALTGSDFQVNGVSNGAWFLGSGRGAGIMDGFAGLVGVPLPHGDYRMSSEAVGMALGFSSAMGELYASAATSVEENRTAGVPGFGVRSWAPRSVISTSFIPTGADYALGASFASGLSRPSGWDGTGAFALSGDSIDVAWSRQIVANDAFRIGVASRVTHLAPDGSSLVDFPDVLTATAEIDVTARLSRHVALNARAGLERPVAAGSGTIRTASSIDESGRIGYDDIRIDQADLLAFEKVGVTVQYSPTSDSTYGAGVMAIRDGFGETDAIAGVRAEIRY